MVTFCLYQIELTTWSGLPPSAGLLMGDVNTAMTPPDGEVTDDRSWPSL
jgi:hypothetical protein